jgi:5-methyltetrahydropteroyltriglutamate--homocysteine methyltransferase
MRVEYKMIVDAGFVLQIDDARAANAFDRMVPPATMDEYRRWLAKFVESLNLARKASPRIAFAITSAGGAGPARMSATSRSRTSSISS